MSEWRKSSFSQSGDSSCVEVRWRKSSVSQGAGSGCVEVAFRATCVAVRDSKHTGPMISVPELAWHRFVRGAGGGARA
ncbi:DUF397 domain-containing protein [Actinophytocola sp.]|uniref:DUF397 domain-containing protein n=1 Tax=Actinophytocola sp. TaxID=1872138 RepID=UPI003D6AD7D2